jgi:hypothetical protein
MPWNCSRKSQLPNKSRAAASLLACIFLSLAAFCQEPGLRTVHVFVALADNQFQGIVPVPAKLGNGEDAERNLYWGSAYGVKTFFARSAEWQRITCEHNPKVEILERCIFKFRTANVYLVADAYRGREIKQAILDFLDSAAGDGAEKINLHAESGTFELPIHGGANLVAYVGHDGLMDFQLPKLIHKKNDNHRDAIVLACASKQYFAESVRASGASPLLWTTGLMAPEAYTLKSALDGWIAGEGSEQIRNRAAAAYDKYQKCGLRAAQRLLVSGW